MELHQTRACSLESIILSKAQGGLTGLNQWKPSVISWPIFEKDALSVFCVPMSGLQQEAKEKTPEIL